MVKFDKDTDEFLDALSEGTESTYRPGLAAFQEFYGKSPGHFLDAIEADMKLPRHKKQRVARNTLKRFVKWMEQKNLTSKSVRTYIAAVQSLCAYYDMKISIRYVDVPAGTPESKKFPWTIETIAKFIGEIREIELKSIAVTIFQSGMGVSDILLLEFADIKYEYQHRISPLCLDLARHKTKVPFMSFMGSWGEHLLRTVLKGRRLRLDSALYSMAHRTIDDKFQRLGKKFVGTYKGQNPCRPHSLRAGFRTLLGDAGMDRDVAKFFMGQTLPEQDKVYHSRSREGWRKQYVKYAAALSPKNWRNI